MDFQTARLAMVESQIRPNAVRDPLILNAFATLPREAFVPESQKALAYMDEAVPVLPAAEGSPPRYLLPSMVLAKLLQGAAVSPSDHALDIGGATGYSAAVLAQICRKVEALETSEALAGAMKQNLKAANAEQVSVHHGPLNRGVDASKPYDLILLNGSVAEEPKELFDQLAEGGRLVTIMRRGWQGYAVLFTKSSGAVSGRPIFDAAAEYLPGFEKHPNFVF
jgi:protein-L-isoaspartate(D-aspartate) O-methyltransferase